MGRRLASLDCYHPEAVDLWAARLGNSMAAQQWTTLGLQKIRRVFRRRRSTQVAVPPLPKNSRPSLRLSLKSGRRSLACWSVSRRHHLPRGQAWLPVKCAQAISEATVVQTFLIQTFRGSIACKMTDNTFSKLRITRAYIKLLCIPEGDARMVSLVQIGNYEIRMLDASNADTADGPLFLIELFDHDAQSSVDSRICDDIEEGVAAFEDFISR